MTAWRCSALAVYESASSVGELESDRQVIEPARPGLRCHRGYKPSEAGQSDAAQIDDKQAHNLVLEGRAASGGGEGMCASHPSSVALTCPTRLTSG